MQGPQFYFIFIYVKYHYFNIKCNIIYLNIVKYNFYPYINITCYP